jgi:uncharacterized protein (TIGR03435 family)
MPKKLLLKISFWIAIPAAFGQSFEVATIKPAMPVRQRRALGVNNRIGTKGGPGTDDPGLFTCNFCSVLDLVEEAYHLTQSYQFSPPHTQDEPRFDITAKIPVGATREQFRAMLIDLLNDRFKLSVHKEKREMPVFELVVMKGGPKLKESAGGPVESDPAPAPARGARGFARDQDGFPIRDAPLPKGVFNISNTGLARIEGRNETMQDLADRLDGLLDKPVIDGTGLTKKYDYRITFSSATILANGGRGRGDAPPDPNTPLASVPDNAGTTIEGAIQSQLGLKLESKKAPIEVLVVDHAEKTPTEN